MRAVILFLFLTSYYCSFQQAVAGEIIDNKKNEITKSPVLVSIINLIATPERYDKKFIDVTGFATIELENMSLCLSKQSLSTSECIWIELYEPEKDIETAKKREKCLLKFHKKVVSLQGIFDMNNTGHFGFWPAGAIKSITHVSAVQDH